MGLNKSAPIRVEPYTRCTSGDIAEYVLILPSRDYVGTLIDRLEEFEVETKIEGKGPYLTVTGKYRGELPVTIASAGPGGPALAIALEEYTHLGARVFVKVGFATAISTRIGIGDIILAATAIRGEGTSQHYLPIGYPAYANISLLQYAEEALRAYNATKPKGQELGYYIGTVLSTDVLYNVEYLLRTWSGVDVLAIDMETSVLYILSSLRKTKSLSVLIVDSSIVKGIPPGELSADYRLAEIAQKVSENIMLVSQIMMDVMMRLRTEVREEKELKRSTTIAEKGSR